MKISVSLEIVIRLFFCQDCTFELLTVPTYNESEETEVARMREQKFHIYLDSQERTILLHSLRRRLQRCDRTAAHRTPGSEVRIEIFK